MPTLSPRARRLDDEIELAIHERSARRVVKLVESWGLPRDQRSPAKDDVASWFDCFDRTHARSVADVWARS